MLSDTLSDALHEIEDYEREYPENYSSKAEQIRKVKVEMRLLQFYYDLPPGICEQYTPADYDWLRTESLKRAASKAPHQFSEVMGECMHELARNKFKLSRGKI